MNPLQLPLMQMLMPLETAIAVPSALSSTGDFAARLATQLTIGETTPSTDTIDLPAPVAPPTAASPAAFGSMPIAQPKVQLAPRPVDPPSTDEPPAASPVVEIRKPAHIIQAAPALPVPPETAAIPQLAALPSARPAIRSLGAGKPDRPLASEAAPEREIEDAPSAPIPEVVARPLVPTPPERRVAVADSAAFPEPRPISSQAAPRTIARPPLPTPQPALVSETVSSAATVEAAPFEMPPMPATLSVLQVADTTPATAPDSAKPLDLQHSEWVAKLSQEIVSAHESGQPLAFRLAPQFLGELKVGLTETAQGLVIELQPSSREAAAIIAREEPRLVEELRQRGVQVSEATLQFGASNDGRNSRNGANLRPFQPLQLSDPARVQDQNQHHTRPLGRFA